MRTKLFVEAGVVAAILALAPVAATAAGDRDTSRKAERTSAGQGEASPDAWLTTKAKIAVLTETGVSGSNVNVDTVNGRVTLHGTVASADDKERAEKVVRDIEGVREVRNLLQVVKKGREDDVAASDDTIEEKLTKALKDQRDLRDSSISIQSVNDGTVLLGGKANSLSDHLRAIEVARGVSGVRAVHSEIESPDQRGDEEIVRDSAADDVTDKATKKAQSATGAVSDAWITSKAKLRLVADDRTPASDINVDTRNGVVTLFGTVPTAEAKRAAEAETRKVSGVKKVMNELQVVPADQKADTANADGDLQREVEEAIADDEDLANADIDVEVKNGVARLTGEVSSDSERRAATSLVRKTAGIRSVKDELRVEKNARMSE